MKLHLPKSLRTALLTCLAALAPVAVTLATGAISSGLVAFSFSASAEEISITQSTQWANDVNHSADTTTVDGSGVVLTYGDNVDGSWSTSVNAQLGSLTLMNEAQLKIQLRNTGGSTVKTVSTTDKATISGAITLNNGSILIADGSYYFAGMMTVAGNSNITSSWAKGIVIDAINGDEDAQLTLVSDSNDVDSGALFVLGDGTATEAQFKGTLVLNNTKDASRTTTLAINDANALKDAALQLDSFSNAVVMLDRILVEALYGSGDVAHSYNNVTGHASPVVQITGNATESQLFSGTVASNVTWQIGDGTTAASSRFSGATLNGALNIQANSTAYLTGSNTFGSLTNSGTLHLNEGSSFSITSQEAYQGATITGLGTIAGLSGNTFSYGNGWIATYDSATGTATLTDGSAIYWIDNGTDGDNAWHSAANWQGGAVPTAADIIRLGEEGTGKTVSITENIDINEIRVVQGDYVLTTDGSYTVNGNVAVSMKGATLTKSGTGTLTFASADANALSVAEGELIVSQLNLVSGDTFTKSGAGKLTVTTVDVNALTVAEGELVVSQLNLVSGDTFTKGGAGLMTLSNATTLINKNVKVDAGELHITQTGDNDVAANTTYTVTVEAGATLDDDRRIRLTGGSLTVTGGGIYELEGICLSGTGKNATSLNVGADTTLHITGTTQSAAGNEGSFMLSHWAANNVINIHGVLISEAGISDRDGGAVIYIENGGTLQLNAGLSRTTHGAKDTTIEVKDGANLVVNGSSTSGTDYITTNLAGGATVFTTTGATILNGMVYNGAVKVGAASGTTLSLTADSVSVNALTVLGTADTVNGTAAGGIVEYTGTVTGSSVSLNEGAQFIAADGLTLSGAFTLGENSKATLGGAVIVNSLSNTAGTLHFNDGAKLTITTQEAYEGATITGLGTITGLTDGTFTYGNGWTATYDGTAGTATLSDTAVYWSDGGTDDNIAWSDGSNWSSGSVPASTDAVRLTADNAGKNIAVTSNVTVQELRVYGAYTLDISGSFTATDGYRFYDSASLTKNGTGTLNMTSAEALAAVADGKLTINAGTLHFTDTLAGNGSASNTNADADFSSLSIAANASLSIIGAERNGNNNIRTTVKLGSGFAGKLIVKGGWLDSDSDLGGASALVFDGGNLLARDTRNNHTISTNIEIGATGTTFAHLGVGGNGTENTYYTTLSGSLAGSGDITFIENGDWYLTGDMSGFTGSLIQNSANMNLFLRGNAQNLKSFSTVDGTTLYVGTADNSVTVATGTGRTQSGNFNLDVASGSKFTEKGTLNQTGGTFVVKSGGTYEAQHISLAAGTKLDVQGASKVNILGVADTAFSMSAGEIAIATDAVVSDSRALTLDGNLSITGEGTYKQLGSLTISDGSTLTLSGKVTLTQLDNNGVITLADSLSSLTLVGFSDQTNINGSTYEIGTVTDGADKDWNALLGVTGAQISYDATTGLLTAEEASGLVWADLTGDTENSWNEASNWQDANGNAAYVPVATSKVVLGVGTAEGYDNTVTLTGTVEIASLTVQSNHNISVAADDSATLTAAAITLENGATLTKTGEGTLVIAKDVSAFSEIAAGTLKLDGAFTGYDGGDSSAKTAHDLTRFTGSGTLAVNLYGSETTSGRSLVSLSDSFTGTLEVQGGSLDRNSTMGGVTAVKLNNGGLFGRETASGGSHDFSKNIIVEGNSWLNGQGGTGEDNSDYYVNLTGAISGDGELSVKGLCDWHFKGDMSGFTGSIKLESGTGETPDWVIFHSNADLSALTMNAGTLKVTDNALLAVETLSQTGGAINVASGASLELKGTATLKSISNSGVLKLQNADALTLVGFNDSATTVNGTQTFTLGEVENATEINWNTLTGVSIADYRVKYSGGTVSYASATDTYIVWADTDDEETAWGEGCNWRWADDNSLAAVPTSAQKVQLTADAAHKTITLSGAASVAELNVQGAYELNVAEGDTAILSATNLSVGDSGSLTKAGTGTLTMSKDNATAGGISISEGTLKLSEASYANSSVHDLSSITASADGTLQMNGSANSWASGTNYGISVILSDDFEGTLKMTSGQLNVNNGSGAESVFGGAKAISLEGATVAIGGGELSVPDLIFNGNNTTILSHGTSTISSDISGSGTINRHGGNAATLNLTGDISYDGTFIQQKATLNLAGDNAAYIKNLKIQGGTVTISSGLSSDSGLTVTGGTTNLNGSSDLGIVSMSNGTFGVNATTQIDELSVTGGTFKINGAEVNVGSLKSGALTLTGAADLTAVLADTAQVTLNGAATADATLSVVAGGSATLSVAESLKSLTVTEGGVLALSGALTLGDLYNTGTLDIANLSALTIGGLDLVDGSEYEVGTLTGADAVDWNTLLGLDSSLTAAYNGSKIVLSLSDTPVLWVGDADSTWDEADENGASTAWKQGENAFTPGANTAVVLGNAASLGDLNDVVARTIILDANTVVGSVTVQDAYSLSVADGASHSFDAGTIVLEGGSLSKTGAGTLSMSLEDAVTAQMNIAEGTLSISETLDNYENGTRVDLTALSGVGTLSITAVGESGVTGNGTGQRTVVDLADSFTGTLAVVGGNLDMASSIGGAGSVLLDGATLVGTGSVVQELGWNIEVSDNDAYLRRFGNAGWDERTSYATRLTGTLTGSADAMLKVIDSGEWFLAGDMSGYQGGMSIEGDTNYVTFESNATLASLTAVNNSHILVDNNATLTAPALAVSGTIYTGATEGATFNMGAVTIANNGTLNISGAGEHTATSVDMSAATTSLTLGENAKLTVSGLLNGDENGDAETLNITLGAGAVLNLEQTGHKRTIGTTVNISLGANAVMTDAAWRRLGNSSLNITGNGVYNVEALQLSNGANGATNVTIGAGATLHITGTANNSGGDGGALLTGTNNFDNTITVRGTLALECGISRYNIDDTANTINVENGGKIAFNKGLTAANEGANAAKDAINIAGGGVLEISGTNTGGTDRVAVNMAQDSILMGGNANGATESKVTNNLNFDNGAYIGAKAGTTFTIAPEDGSTNLKWLDIIGTGDTQGSAQGAGGTVNFASAVVVDSSFKVLAGATAEFDSTLNVGWVENFGNLTVQGAMTAGTSIDNKAGAVATFKDSVSLTTYFTNAGKLVFDGADNITLAQSIQNSGTVEVLNASGTRFTLADAMLTANVDNVVKTWTLVNNDATGTVTGWDALTLENFLLNGAALEQGDWDAVSIADGKVSLYMLYRYWDSVDGEDSNVWDTNNGTVWRDRETMEGLVYESGSRVAFGEYEDVDDINQGTGTTPLNKNVTVAEGGVVAKALDVFGEGYVFSGGKVAVTQSMSIQRDATFESTLVIGSTTTPLSVDVWEGKTLTVGTLETSSSVSYGSTIYNNGALSMVGEGTMHVTDAVNGKLTQVSSLGTLKLGVKATDGAAAKTITLAVGSNELTTAGGTLQNVVLTAADNSIAAADSTLGKAVLTDVSLEAGAAASYATLQDVSFAGNSALSGYIALTAPESMQVAAGSTLEIGNLTLDLAGTGLGEQVVIANGATTSGLGTLNGWTSDKVSLVYNGVAVNEASVTLSDTAGKLSIASSAAGALYWDGIGADGNATGDWNTTAAAWNTSEGADGTSTYKALSDIFFGAPAEGGSKTVTVAADMDMLSFTVKQGGYSFSGAGLNTLGAMSVAATGGDVSFRTVLTSGDTLATSGDGKVSFGEAVTAAKGITLGSATTEIAGAMTATTGNIAITSKTINVSGSVTAADGNITITSGNSEHAGEGRLTLASGSALTAQNISIHVDAGASTDSDFSQTFVDADGSITATDTLSITGTATKDFTGGTIIADKVIVNTGSSNLVKFETTDIGTLTIESGSRADITVASAMDTIVLKGTLGMTVFAGNYAGARTYNVVAASADAYVEYATIAKSKFAVTGDTGVEGQPYGSITFGPGYRELTITSLEKVQNLNIGAAEYWAKLNNATGGIHGNFTAIGGSGVEIFSDNIMAETNTTGHWELGTTINLNSTVQTLRGNTVNMTGAVITGDAAATGLSFADSSTINYGGSNTISANMTVADGKTLTLKAGYAASQSQSTVALSSDDDTLLLSGALSGTGALKLTGDGVVTINKANSAYTGTVTVGGGSSLELTHVDALSKAAISLAGDGTLVLNAGAPVNVAGLTIADGASLSLIGLAPTDAADLTAAGLINADANGINWTKNGDSLTLNILLDQEVENMMTYNLFTDKQALATSGVTLKVFHNGQELDASQYNVGYDADKKLVYIRTMIGNIWNGGSKLDGETHTADGIWGLANEDANWSGKNYTDSKAAIFVDVKAAEGDAGYAQVTLTDKVSPGDVYFEADTTYYQLNSAAGDATAGLAKGTNIHKAGDAYVNLSLANNGTMENAIGNIDLQKGHIYLGENLAVSGKVVIAKDAHLRAFEAALVTDNYTAKGDYSNLLMQSDRIAGESAENKGVISSNYANGASIETIAGGSVLLENVTLASGTDRVDSLSGVTIGSNVDVTGNYTLKGAMVFNETLSNTGTVTLDAGMTAEIGQLGYSFTVDDEGASWYTYQLVQGGTINGMSDLLVGDVTIGGVSLGTGLAEDVVTYITNENGSITLSIGKVTGRDEQNNVTSVDGSIGVPQWDERWSNASEQPSLSRRYAGITADTNVSFAEGITNDDDYYWYSSVVNAENANKVNGTGNEVVVTLSSASTGARAAGGSSAGSANLEMWVYDRSGFTTVVAGQYAEAATDAYTQNADTHVLVNSTYGKTETTDAVEKTWVVGGSWNVAQNANSYVTVQDGKILTLVGGSYGANQDGSTYVYVDGGTIKEIFAGGYNGDVASSNLTITGGTLGMTSDTVTKRVYGGSYCGVVHGDVNVTVDGTATITNLVGGNYGGSVKGNITLDLLKGTVDTVHAAGYVASDDKSTSHSKIEGNVKVNLSQGFNITTGLYGGRQSGSGVASISGTSTLNFVDAGLTYDLSSIKIQGFDTITLADGTYVKTKVDSGFATDEASGELTVSGSGVLELTGTNGTDLARDITLEDGATLWFNSDSAGNSIYSKSSRSTLKATAGTTIDITGQPVQGDGLCVWLDLAGHGVDNKGALYKGLSGAATDPSGKVALPRITLSDSASINAEDNIYVIECENAESKLFLQGNTLTKVGANALTFFNTTVDTGNIYVKEGTLGVGYSMRAQSANVIVGGGSTLNITSIGSNTGTAKIGSLSGSGATNLGYILQVTTNDTGNYIPGSDYMTQGADAYGQFSADTGFAYGVYSGKISGASSLYVSGDGTQYLSGSESDYSGGTHLTDSATLYLLGGTEGTATKGASAVTSGVLGTGAIAWDSADATLYLGNGVRVYNNGVCNVDGSSIIIGVEGAPVGAKLAEGTTYLGVHSRGENGSITYITLDNKEYVEVATHNLQSISCDGMYADGTAYVAGTEIDRNKMLLVSKEVWAANEATVTGFSGNGYNEAIYSGVLSGNVSFEKVGIGTLVLDQANEYTGSTTISEGSLVLKGWAQIGSAADGASINVEQQEGTSLVLAYDGSYGDEITGIANNITLTGEGDARWKTDAEHMATSALISDVGADVAFTLSGDISGDGGILHSGAGTLVLSGDSSFTGGTHATNGVVEVQSATGLGSGVVTVDSASDLHVTVEDGTTASRLATTIKAPGSSVKGDVVINGTETTERILNIAVSTNDDKSQGYTAPTTTVGDNGTLLLNGDGINAETDKLSGSGTVAVSDATAGSAGSKMTVNGVAGFTGDFVVEGKDASIDLQTGAFRGGSISVSGNGANVTTKGDVTIVSGESLSLTSKGNAGETDTSAALRTTGAVNVTNGATLSVAAAETSYDEYNLQKLQASASLNGVSDLESVAEGQAYTAMGASAEEVYKGFFNTSVAMNQKAAGSVDAEGGLTLSGGASYETSMANTSLMGGTLTLDTTTTSLLNFDTTLDAGQAAIDGSGRTTQLVLFSDVGGVNFVLDDIEAEAGSGIYYTRADRYIGGSGYVDEETWLVYDSGAGVVYLEGLIPEPTTATLSLLALAALAARRRRK